MALVICSGQRHPDTGQLGAAAWGGVEARGLLVGAEGRTWALSAGEALS